MLAFFLGLLPIVVIFCLSLQYFVFSVTFGYGSTCVLLEPMFGKFYFFFFVMSLLSSGWRECIKLLSVSGFLLFISYHSKISGTLYIFMSLLSIGCLPVV